MIEQVKPFLEKVFQAELEVHNADLIPDLEKYNSKVRELYSYCVPEMKDKLSAIETSMLREADFYEQYKEFRFEHPRFIFKISQYETETYGTVYLAYVSSAKLTRIKFLKYGDCFFVIRQNDTYKIASKYFVYSEYPDSIRWMKNGGPDDLTFEILEKPVAIERYIEPQFSERRPEESNFSIAEHKTDK